MIKSSYAIYISFIGMSVLTFQFSNIMDGVYHENMKLKKKVLQLEELFNIKKHIVTVTMYNPTRGQTDRTPNITADGTKINPKKASSYRYVALSRDLIKRWDGPFNYGDYIIIEGTDGYDGLYQVRDTMNPRFTNRVDILRSKGSEKFKFENIKLYKHKHTEIMIAQND